MNERVSIAVIGSGPGGLSCAARAAEIGLSHVLLEAADHLSHTIYCYQKGKHVMAEPAVLPLRSPLAFAAGKREAVLGAWDRDIARHGANVRFRAEVTKITGEKGAFEIRTASGDVYHAEHVVLGIGLQGNLRKLGVPGEDLPLVQYQLDDPDAYAGETIVVVGSGDAGIENALALAHNNRVVLINRNEEFARAKQGNLDAILAAIQDGRLECRYGTRAVRVEATGADDMPLAFEVQTPNGKDVIACHRIVARLGATPPRKLVESFGVRFPSSDPAAVPQVSEQYESNVPGLYIIGALAGYPLIKQAMNQGYEVVEYIRGNPVEPADEPLLRTKFRNLKGGRSVAEALALVQRNVPLFREMAPLQLREFMLDSEVHTPSERHIVFRKDDYTNSFFSIVSGTVLVEAVDNDGSVKQIELGAGHFFGEMGLLSGRRRTATVRAGPGAVLIETPRRSMLKLMSSVESVRRQIDQAFLRRAVRTHIAPLLSDADLDEIVQGASVKTYAAGETVFAEGDAPDGLHLIRRGSVMIVREIGGKEVVLSYVAAGNYIGEMALLSEARRTATVRAAVNTETILLQAGSFNEVVSRNAALREAMQARAFQRVSRNVRRETETDPGNLIGFLLGQGLGEATDVLLIDESLCTRCDNCERACADTHDGTSRLDREAGPTFANIHVPTSCRHCENPHCMKDCPPDAIHRNPQGEVVIENTCIGCGNCVRNCPYGVVQLAAVDPKRRAASLWAWLLTGLTDEPGRERHRASKDQMKKAVKCDMCKDLRGGPACVRACPTGAAIRVSPEEFLGYATR